MKKNKEYYLFMIIGTIVLTIIFTFLLQWSWNAFVPLVWQGTPTLNFLQSLAVIVFLNVIGSFFRKQ